MEKHAGDDCFEVRTDETREGLGVFAVIRIPAGGRIGYFEGTPTSLRSRLSLQFGPHLYVEPGPQDPLRNLNHACEPSAQFLGRELFALRDLLPGEAVTIDYNLYETEMASPFECRCGAANCVGKVEGWRFLSAADKTLRRTRAGDWLKAL